MAAQASAASSIRHSTSTTVFSWNRAGWKSFISGIAPGAIPPFRFPAETSAKEAQAGPCRVQWGGAPMASTRIKGLAPILFLTAFPCVGQTMSEGQLNGRFWNGASADSKLVYLVAFQDGFFLGHTQGRVSVLDRAFPWTESKTADERIRITRDTNGDAARDQRVYFPAQWRSSKSSRAWTVSTTSRRILFCPSLGA
jgi:hypothetical protein